MKRVKSDHPLKKNIVAHLKAKSGGNKVTNVWEGTNYYEGDCMKYNGSKYDSLGCHRVLKEDVDKKPLDKAFEKMGLK
jgi:hypothetical protein